MQDMRCWDVQHGAWDDVCGVGLHGLRYCDLSYRVEAVPYKHNQHLLRHEPVLHRGHVRRVSNLCIRSLQRRLCDDVHRRLRAGRLHEQRGVRELRGWDVSACVGCDEFEPVPGVQDVRCLRGDNDWCKLLRRGSV